MKNILLLLLLIGSSALCGCIGPGMTGYTINLPGNYAVVAGSPSEVDIRPIDKILDYNTPYIPEKVVEIAFDNRYVLAKRFQVVVDFKENGNGHRVMEKTVDESNPIYYILDTSIPKVYGPYNFEEFNKKKIELKISKKLKLKSVNHYEKVNTFFIDRGTGNINV